MGIDIIVPVKEALRSVDLCLKSVKASIEHLKLHTPSTQASVKIYDDCSSQMVQNFLKERTKAYGFELHLNSQNVGFVKNCNAAMKESKADIIVLLNSDTLVPPNFIDPITDCFQSDPRIAVASPISSNSPHNFIKIPPGLSYSHVQQIIERHGRKNYPELITPEGFCFCLRNEDLKKIGYFDEIFQTGYGEESDLSMRALSMGYRTVCIDNLYLFHQRHMSFTTKRAMELKKKNGAIFFDRWKKVYNSAFKMHMTPSPIAGLRDLIANEARAGVSELQERRVFDKSLDIARSWADAVPLGEELKELYRKTRKLCTGTNLQKKEKTYKHSKEIEFTFVLDNFSCGGGVISVLNLANELVRMGKSVSVLTFHGFEQNQFPDFLFKVGTLSRYSPPPKSKYYIATFWRTAEVLFNQKGVEKESLLYFIQDYESNFYPDDKEAQTRVKETYRMIPKKFAKTQWLIGKLNDEGSTCHKISPGIDLLNFTEKKDPETVEKKEIQIIAMSRPSTPRRNTKLLIQVLNLVTKNFPEVRVVVFGEKPAGASKKIHYLGNLTHKELAGHYQSSDIFIDTSEFHGFGRTGAEALACGCTLVSTDSGGIHEYATHNKNCLIAEEHSVEAVFECIEKLLRDPSLIHKLKAEARKSVELFSDENAAEDFLGFVSSF